MNGKLALEFCHLLKWDLVTNVCPLSGAKRTWPFAVRMSAFGGALGGGFNRSLQHRL